MSLFVCLFLFLGRRHKHLIGAHSGELIGEHSGEREKRTIRYLK